MPSNYDKRDFPRMEVDECTAPYRSVRANRVDSAAVKNLSGNGLLLKVDQALAVGDQLSVEVLPGKAITPSLAALAVVVRCEPLTDGGYAVACSISKVFPPDETPADFP